MSRQPIDRSALSPVRAGDVLGGKFRVERVLGVGGMGVVVAATHLQLDERVALKFLLPSFLSRPEVVARFAREARAAAKIKSEHIARVTDVGSLPDGTPYMVMEYLEGMDFGRLLRREGPLAPELAVGYVLQACEALAEAHALGIVHRDLKPANLFLARERDGHTTLKVLDFGVSRVIDSESGITQADELLGSPLYIPPEQLLASKEADARSDIWSLGVTLHELLVARSPFDADSLPTICARILQGQPDDLHAPHPHLPVELSLIVRRCLAKNPAERFASVAELAVALLPFAPSAERSVQRIVRRLAGVSLAPSSQRSSLPPPPPVVSLLPPDDTSSEATLPYGSAHLASSARASAAYGPAATRPDLLAPASLRPGAAELTASPPDAALTAVDLAQTTVGDVTVITAPPSRLRLLSLALVALLLVVGTALALHRPADPSPGSAPVSSSALAPVASSPASPAPGPTVDVMPTASASPPASTSLLRTPAPRPAATGKTIKKPRHVTID